jgi:SpoVK/Ycf46/Vps4 family AAA+-type ATPase
LQDYSREPVLKEDLEDALSRISPSVRAEDVKRHEEWFKLYGSS